MPRKKSWLYVGECTPAIDPFFTRAMGVDWYVGVAEDKPVPNASNATNEFHIFFAVHPEIQMSNFFCPYILRTFSSFPFRDSLYGKELLKPCIANQSFWTVTQRANTTPCQFEDVTHSRIADRGKTRVVNGIRTRKEGHDSGRTKSG